MAFTTRKSLLAQLRAGGEIPWREFYTAYKPLILLCGGDCGAEARVQGRVTTAFTGSLDDFLGDAGEDGAAFGVSRALLVLDRRPFIVS